jgi:hypothetical protein
MRAASRHHLRVLALVGVSACALATATFGTASFTTSAVGGGTAVATATLAAPTALTVSCKKGVATLTWTATPSLFADGYDVYRTTTTGGPYTSVALVPGQATVTFNDTPPPTGTFYYVVAATKGNWRSGNTNEISVKLPPC